VRHAWRLATGGLLPELSIFVDVPVDLGLRRVGRRGAKDRLEAEDRAFHERVREGYLELLASEPERWVRVDGARREADVAHDIREAVFERLGVRAHGLR